MAKKEKLNEEAAMNLNLGSSTYRLNRNIAKLHRKPQVTKNKQK